MSRTTALCGALLLGFPPACTPAPPTVDCGACPRPELAEPAPVECPAPPPAPSPAPPVSAPPLASPPVPAAAPIFTPTTPAFPLETDDDESDPLSYLFQPKLTALEIEERTTDRTYGRVNLRIASFVVRGRSPAVRLLNDELRLHEGRDEWGKHTRGYEGDIDVSCTAGVATTELFSFACEVLDSRMRSEDLAAGTGGAPARPTPSSYTVAIVDGTPAPIALADLLRPDADIVALAAVVAAEDGEYKDSNEHQPWRARECDIIPDGNWLLSSDGITLYGTGQDCPPLALDLEALDPLLLPGGVVARYLAAARATAAAAERKAAAEAAAAAPVPAPAP